MCRRREAAHTELESQFATESAGPVASATPATQTGGSDPVEVSVAPAPAETSMDAATAEAIAHIVEDEEDDPDL